jgi:FkbM family methyltransferase
LDTIETIARRLQQLSDLEHELESILQSLVANDTAIIDGLAQMLSVLQEMQARSEASQRKVSEEIRTWSLELIEAVGKQRGTAREIVLARDPFVAQNPDVGLLQHLYSFLSDTNAIDVGANVGEVSERLLDSGYTVYAFEPYPPAFEKLNTRLKAVPSFHSFNYALGPHDAVMNLHIATDLSGKRDATLYHSLIEHPLLADLKFSETRAVQVRSLDSLRRTGEIPDRAGVLKIDAEGYDLEIIRGMGTPQFAVVVAEFWDGEHPFGRAGNGKLDDIVTALKQRGYSWHVVIYHLDETSPPSFYCNRRQTVPESWGNALFFRDHALFANALAWCEAVIKPTLYR